VGGHCISVDPYYLIERSQLYGVLPRVMSNARRLNNSMGAYVANQTIRQMNLKGLPVKDARILILGFTFKENCPDIRNTKVIDIYHTLHEYTPNITVLDPWVDTERARAEYGIEVINHLSNKSNHSFDAVILAVSHNEFSALDIRALAPQPAVVFDVKGFLPRNVIDARL
jgi:UDP-N-acetyl-D-galactosamine dehydrogenase